METAFIILACFSGMFGFAFVLAGLLGMLDFETKYDADAESQSQLRTLWLLVDLVITQGLILMMSAVGRNWNSRPSERRFFLLGVAFSVVFVVCLIVLAQI